jgi:hypothetical protein
VSSMAPLRAVGNLRLTRTGVYAEYLLSGLPFIFLSKEWQNMVAAEHAELWRTLPSGATISGLTVPVPARTVIRKMLYAHPDLRGDGGGCARDGADGLNAATGPSAGAHCPTKASVQRQRSG